MQHAASCLCRIYMGAPQNTGARQMAKVWGQKEF